MPNKMRLLTPGPTPLPEEVRLALAQDMIHHRKEQFREIMAQAQRGLRILFGTSDPVLPLACTGTGAMTAAVVSLFRPGDRVLSVEAGKFGQRWTEIALSRDLDVRRLELPWGDIARPEDIEAILLDDPLIRGVLIQQSETSTGALMPIREIGEVTRKSQALLVVDGISAVGISPCPMEEWGIDCLLTGSQKGLMLPPGLALISLSERAWRRAEECQPGCYYFNLPAERKNLEKGQTNFTSAINLIRGLNISLELMLANGLDAIYRRQWALTSLVRAGAAAMGLEPFVKHDYAWGVTSLELPPNVDPATLLRQMESRYGVVMAGGQDQLKGRIIRLGHMGWVDWGDCMAGLTALKACLEAEGVAMRDFMDAAMRAYADALGKLPVK